MRIVIFTPTNYTSAIGGVASSITNALAAQRHEITVVRSQSDRLFNEREHAFSARFVSWNDPAQVTNVAAEADAIIYQIGDFYDYHTGCLEWLPHFPGIVCLHDFFLGNLFLAWAQTRLQEADAIIRAWYGDEATRGYFAHSGLDSFIKATSGTCPLTEWICSQAYSVVTHSSWGIDRVLDSCPGPVQVIPLCPGKAIGASLGPSNIDGKFLLLTIGRMNSNKRTRSVIEAIGSSTLLRDRVIYRLAGRIEAAFAEEISKRARELSVTLLISGEVSEEELSQAFDEADAISCLRWPVLEAASASLIEALHYGKPTIVSNAGFYTEIPDSCVVKIDPENEVEELRAALESFCGDVKSARALGIRGKEWAEKTFSVENYSRRLLELIDLTNKAKPIIAATNMLMNLMSAWKAHEKLATLKDTVAPLRILAPCISRGQTSEAL